MKKRDTPKGKTPPAGSLWDHLSSANKVPVHIVGNQQANLIAQGQMKEYRESFENDRMTLKPYPAKASEAIHCYNKKHVLPGNATKDKSRNGIV